MPSHRESVPLPDELLARSFIMMAIVSPSGSCEWCGCGGSVEAVVRDDRQEFTQVVVQRERREDLARIVEVAGLECGFPDFATDRCHLVLDHRRHDSRADFAAVIQSSPVTQPLPQLRP